MILPEYTEKLRQHLAATPGVDRVFVGRAETFFLSGELPLHSDAAQLLHHLDEQRRAAGLPPLDVNLTVVRVLPGAAGGTYFEAYARRPREF